MADNINLIVNETIENVVINPSITNEIVDITVGGTDTIVDISVTPNLTIVNVNTVVGVVNPVTSVNGQTGDVVLEFNGYFIHIQNSAISEWNITHNLNKYAAVTVVDSGNNTVIGEVEYTSLNTVTLRFNASFSGKAFFN